ncbi:MAG: CBS domain-containing protein, partial [Sinomicrobium sp.]|nr:CBS domain-containing protein [Sinomicrobium sp.]
DGDIRRMLNKYEHINMLKARDIMSFSPKKISADAMAVDALEMMEEHGISQLLVEERGTYAGVIHLHNLIREGII